MSEPEQPSADGHDESDPDWVEVRESWVGDRSSEPLPIEPYVAAVLPPPPPDAGPDVAPGFHAPPEVSRLVMPASVPPPLPPSTRPMPLAGGADVFEAFSLGDAHTRGPAPVPERSHTMLDRLVASDYDGALRAAESLLRIDPDDGEAAQCRELCCNELRKLYLARIGDTNVTPRLVVDANGLRMIDVDLRTGLVLARVDGRATVDDVVRAGVVSELDALRILSELLLSGVLMMTPTSPTASV